VCEFDLFDRFGEGAHLDTFDGVGGMVDRTPNAKVTTIRGDFQSHTPLPFLTMTCEK